MLLVLEKLKELGVPCDVAAVISDFELNILKAVDDMLEIDVEGCFFHFSKCLKTKVDKRHFKTRYENDLRSSSNSLKSVELLLIFLLKI